jgi:hypothetical protein
LTVSHSTSSQKEESPSILVSGRSVTSLSTTQPSKWHYYERGSEGHHFNIDIAPPAWSLDRALLLRVNLANAQSTSRSPMNGNRRPGIRSGAVRISSLIAYVRLAAFRRLIPSHGLTKFLSKQAQTS